jgi:hypothetical protein
VDPNINDLFLDTAFMGNSVRETPEREIGIHQDIDFGKNRNGSFHLK